ncbi:MAG: hypothetical protein L6R40_008541 [Gallowayella cf. fulva]|nr:MAG: hypothetical protein L6R40_008541 [Xanthomendoza cf. fulva]
MAAQSRLALRSSARNSQELPATVIQRIPSPVSDKKRTYPPSNNLSDGRVAKRTRNDAETTAFRARTAKVYSRKLVPAAEEAVTQVARNPPAQLTPVVQQHPCDPTTNDPPPSTTRDRTSTETPNAPAINRLDKRSLRSHAGGSRFKSELAFYFADYDEVLSDEPRKQGRFRLYPVVFNAIDPVLEFLTPETRVYIVDEPPTSFTFTTIPPLASTYGERSRQQASVGNDEGNNSTAQLNGRRDGDGFHLNHAERLDFSSAERHSRHITEDPLTDQLYFKAHRRAERGEKQHRNREKESAQHEQSQLERILSGLEGPAWLKTMGITGITDSEKRNYEPKRIVFINRVSALLDKFRAWKEEEKRRKAERERSCTADVDDEGEEESESDQSDSVAGLDGIDERNSLKRRKGASSRSKDHRQKSSAATRIGPSTTSRAVRSQHVNLLPLPVEKPFTSFYSKPYQREAALSGHRRGRLRFAFGQQIPELEQQDFNLPAGMLTRYVLTANARSKRAAKRNHKDD